jgi:hypothetical protein
MSQHKNCSSFNPKRKYTEENVEKENKKRKLTPKQTLKVTDLPETLKLTDLPEVPLLQIASFLSGDDLLKFSHLNRQLFHICNSSSSIWKNALKLDGLTFSRIIRKTAQSMSDRWMSDKCMSDKCMSDKWSTDRSSSEKSISDKLSSDKSMSEQSSSEPKPNVDKLSYLLHLRTKRNWKSGKIARTITLPALQGHPGTSINFA